jgi:hypothetical protein
MSNSGRRGPNFLDGPHAPFQHFLGRAKVQAFFADLTLGSRSCGHIGFTAGRDAVVREDHTDWLISEGEYSFRIQNDTGSPARPTATLDLANACEFSGSQSWERRAAPTFSESLLERRSLLPRLRSPPRANRS